MPVLSVHNWKPWDYKVLVKKLGFWTRLSYYLQVFPSLALGPWPSCFISSCKQWSSYTHAFIDVLSPGPGLNTFMALFISEKHMWKEGRLYVIASMMFSIFSSVQLSRSVVSDSLRPHEPQHARPPCPSPTPGVHPNPCPSSQWCHPAISSSVIPFSSCPQSFPASGSFPMSQFFTSGGQSIAVSASTSVLPMNTQDWSPLGWNSWISLQFKGLSRVSSNTTVQNHQFLGDQLSLWSNSHIHTWSNSHIHSFD